MFLTWPGPRRSPTPLSWHQGPPFREASKCALQRKQLCFPRDNVKAHSFQETDQRGSVSRKVNVSNTPRENGPRKHRRKRIMSPKEAFLVFYMNQTVHIWETKEPRSEQDKFLCVAQHRSCLPRRMKVETQKLFDFKVGHPCAAPHLLLGGWPFITNGTASELHRRKKETQIPQPPTKMGLPRPIERSRRFAGSLLVNFIER